MSGTGVQVSAGRVSSSSAAVPPPRQQQQEITVARFSDEAVEHFIRRYKEIQRADRREDEELRGWLMLLTTLTASITYAAALNPPGGVWQADDPGKGYVAGYPVLREKSAWRYFVFYYSNATSFASSVCIIVLLAITKLFSDTRVMVFNVLVALDMASLTAAFAAGSASSRKFAAYNAVLMAILAALFLVWKRNSLLQR